MISWFIVLIFIMIILSPVCYAHLCTGPLVLAVECHLLCQDSQIFRKKIWWSLSFRTKSSEISSLVPLPWFPSMAFYDDTPRPKSHFHHVWNPWVLTARGRGLRWSPAHEILMSVALKKMEGSTFWIILRIWKHEFDLVISCHLLFSKFRMLHIHPRVTCLFRFSNGSPMPVNWTGPELNRRCIMDRLRFLSQRGMDQQWSICSSPAGWLMNLGLFIIPSQYIPIFSTTFFIWLVVTGTFGLWLSIYWEYIIIPTDFIFQRGRLLKTTNQSCVSLWSQQKSFGFMAIHHGVTVFWTSAEVVLRRADVWNAWGSTAISRSKWKQAR